MEQEKQLGASNRSSGAAARRVTFQIVLNELKRRNFGVISTVTKDGRCHSTGITYAVSLIEGPLEIYVMSRRKNRKVRNIMANPNVSVVVPLTRRLLTFLPPPCIQFQGKAEILDWKDEAGVRTFKVSYVNRTILGMYEKLYQRGERGICFLRITPDKVIFTYGLGYSIWELRQSMGKGLAKVEIPEEYRKKD